MSTETMRLLVIDDSVADARLLQALLQQARPGTFCLQHCRTASEGLRCLEYASFDCVFLDYQLGGTDGLQILRAIRERGDDVPVITFSGCGSEEVAVEAMKLGAQDYLVKGNVTVQAVERALTNALDKVSMTRKLAEQQRELRDFANVAAHDLAAPLRRIAGYASWIVDGFADSVDAEVLQKLGIIRTNAERMQRLLDSLLEFTRVGRLQVPLQPVDLNDVLAMSRENLEAVIQETGASIDIGSLPTVLGNEVTLVQLFQNLLANALKFQADQPPVVKVSAREFCGQWQVSIADNGIGIDREHQELIFAPFRRLHSQKKFEGSGIGLATCKRIIDQHRGRIWVESEPGKGATFSIMLEKLPETFSDSGHHANGKRADAQADPPECTAQEHAANAAVHNFGDSLPAG